MSNKKQHKQLDKDVVSIIHKICMSTFVVFLIILGVYGCTKLVTESDKEIMLGTHTQDNRFVYDISKQWKEAAHGYIYGEQVDLVLNNYTAKKLTDWKIELEIEGGCHLDSFWNGDFEMDEKNHIITISPVDFNEYIDVYEEQPFGMILYSATENPIKSGRFIYHEDVKLTEMAIFWIVILLFVIYLSSCGSAIYYTIKHIKDRKQKQVYYEIINQSFITFANTIDAKDSYTKGHSQRVAIYARELARRLKLDEDFCQNIFYVGLLHDIGKIGVTDAILKKNAKLTYDEFNEIKEHVSMGGDILKNFTAVKGIEDGARYHHEKYDGSGYMEGLSGENIPLVARIITVADSFDAMSSARCYRSALDKDKIIQELRAYTGTQFDPKIVPHMIAMINEGKAPVVISDDQLLREFKMGL